MRTGQFALLLSALALAGCDRITGADQQKSLDAEAIGYACRISLTTPQECMQENDTHSPTSILYGWKEADKDVREKVVDPGMGKNQPAPETQPGPAPAAVTGSKPAVAAAEKPAAAAGKPEQETAAKQTAP